MTRKPIRSQEGRAEENGFMLRIRAPAYKRIDSDFFKTPNYEITDYDPMFSIIDWLFTGLVLVLYSFILSSVINLQNIFIEMLGYAIMIISVLYTPNLFYMFRNRQIREWHACEQQTINLLESCDDINMENLKRASRIRRDCGTGMLCTRTFSFIYCILVYYLCYGCIRFFSIENSFFCLSIFVIISVTFWRLYYPLFILKLFSPLTQYFITTAKPSEDKLEQALEVAKKIDRIVS